MIFGLARPVLFGGFMENARVKIFGRLMGKFRVAMRVGIALAVALMCIGCADHILPSAASGNGGGSLPSGSGPVETSSVPAGSSTTGLGAGHVHFFEAEVVAPSCVEDGYTVFICIACGDSYEDCCVPALGHMWEDWVVIKEATENATGLRARTCGACGQTEESVIDRLSGADGHVHGYAGKVVSSTCTEAGYTVYVCECGASYREDFTSPLGHAYVKDVTKATCEKDGYTIYTCSACGDSYKGDEIRATGHDYADTVIAPTCDKEGFTIHTCENCGASYEDSVVKATGHRWGGWQVAEVATCVKEGVCERVCSGCDKVETKKVAAKGHDYQETVVDATCAEDGFAEKVCKACGNCVRESLPALGHDWDGWVITEEATVETPGEKHRQCCRCGAVEVEVIPKLDETHEHVWAVRKVGATCTERGYTEKYCSDCGEVAYQYNYVSAVGHGWSDWEVIEEPTDSSEGCQRRVCDRCGEIQEVVLPALEPGTGGSQEGYIDPRVSVKKWPGFVAYDYGAFAVTDRRSWGGPLSVWVNDDGSLKIGFYNQDGEWIEFGLDVPPEGYVRSCTIKDDGTYVVTLIGDPS